MMPDCELQGLNWPGVLWQSNNPHTASKSGRRAGLWQQGVNLVFADEAAWSPYKQ